MIGVSDRYMYVKGFMDHFEHLLPMLALKKGFRKRKTFFIFIFFYYALHKTSYTVTEVDKKREISDLRRRETVISL